jgi:hypothetical protein
MIVNLTCYLNVTRSIYTTAGRAGTIKLFHLCRDVFSVWQLRAGYAIMFFTIEKLTYYQGKLSSISTWQLEKQ